MRFKRFSICRSFDMTLFRSSDTNHPYEIRYKNSVVYKLIVFITCHSFVAQSIVYWLLLFVACFSLSAAAYSEKFVCSVVLGDDLVARLGVYSVFDLKYKVLKMLRNCDIPKVYWHSVNQSHSYYCCCYCFTCSGDDASSMMALGME